MTWTIKIDKKAVKEIAALDKPVKKRIVEFLKKLATIQNPRSIGAALHGQLKKFWKYRVGDYRIICSIEDRTVTILLLAIKHRREAYKKDI